MIKKTLVETDSGKFLKAEPVDIAGVKKDTLMIRTQAHGDLFVNLDDKLSEGDKPRRVVIDNGTGTLMGLL